MKIDDYTPTEEEKKIVLKSNMLFLTIYGSATVAGFGLGVGITHLRKKPFKSFRTMLSIFMYGVTGELVGRYLGQYTAMQSLKVNLPLQSELRGIMFKY
ncbi:hypothetical protein BC833DRAFT_601189 [Globomyces pollinis-pini]|nr:hypothetical protein BC833DRAFT_601189 [Globomyces pollinis-pini]